MSALVNEHSQLEIDVFRRPQPVKVSQHRCDVLIPRRSMYQSDGGVEHRPKLTELGRCREVLRVLRCCSRDVAVTTDSSNKTHMIQNRDLQKKYEEIFTTDMYRACWRTSWDRISSCSYQWCWSSEWHWHYSLICLFHRISSVLNRQPVWLVLPLECPPHTEGTFHRKFQLLTTHEHITLASQSELEKPQFLCKNWKKDFITT